MLVAPLFIDWSNHKETFEREASAFIGHRVRVKGEAEAKFLPIPTFTFTNIEVGESRGDPIMSAARLKLRLELIPLLQRQFDVIDMQLDSPQISARFNEDGVSNWKLDEASPKINEGISVKLGPVTIREGAIYAVDELTDKTIQLNDITATLSAQSLRGPWKLNGEALFNQNEAFRFAVSTGKFANGKSRMKAKIAPQDIDFDTIFDGEVVLPNTKDTKSTPSYKGALTATPRRTQEKGNQNTQAKTDKEADQQQWRLNGDFNLTREEFSLKKATFEDGAPASPVNLNGSMLIPFDDDIRFKAKVTSRQIDLDRSYGKKQEGRISLNNAQDIITKVFQRLPKPPIPGTIDVDVPGIIVSGDLVRSVEFTTTPIEAGWKIDDFKAALPGSTAVGYSGTIATESEIAIDGQINLHSKQPAALSRWWLPKDDKTARRIPINNLKFDGKLTADKSAVSLSAINAQLDDSDIAGSISINQLKEPQKQIDANLTSTTLDLDAIEALRDLFIGPRNITGFDKGDKITLTLAADKLISNTIEGRSANVTMSISNGQIDITSLKIEDFAGLKIDASGIVDNVLTTPAGRFNGAIKADTKDGLIKISEAFIPRHPLMDYLRRHGGSLVPLDVNVSFSGDYENDKDKTKPSDFAATITGTIGGGKVSTGMRFQGDWQKPYDGDVEASFNATYPDSLDFINQLGLPNFNIEGRDTAAIDIRAKGTPKTGIAIQTDSTLNGVRLKATTALKMEKDKEPDYNGALELASDNSEPLLRLLGFSLPASGLGTAVDLKSTIKGKGWKGDLQNLSGTLGDNTLQAELSYQGAAPKKASTWRWKGTVSTKHVSLPWLAALNTGEIISPLDLNISPEGVGEAGNVIDEEGDGALNQGFWSKAQYGNPYLKNLHADIAIAADQLELSEQNALQIAKFDLKLRPQSLALNNVTGKFKNGDVKGLLNFENNDGTVTLSGTLDLSKADANQLLWSVESDPLIDGQFSLSSQFSGTGRSLDTIIDTLGGDGSLTLEDARIKRLNPETFKELVKAADSDIELDAKTFAPLVARHLDAGSLSIKKAESTFTLSSGVARISKTSLNADTLNARVGATLDLPQMTLKGTVNLNVDAALVDKTPVKGSSPEIALTFEGPLDQPARSLDLQVLLSYLSVRRFEQEAQRIKILQADILEKQRLSRYARWISAEEEREQQAAIEAEERRKAQEAKAQAEEDARLKAEQEEQEKAAALAQQYRPSEVQNNQAEKPEETNDTPNGNRIVPPTPTPSPLLSAP